MNLNEKIAKIRNLVEMLQKDAKGYNYKYVPDYAVLAKITAGLSKYKVDVYPSVVRAQRTLNRFLTRKRSSTVTKTSWKKASTK